VDAFAIAAARFGRKLASAGVALVEDQVDDKIKAAGIPFIGFLGDFDLADDGAA
jgi:hypothetical protein